MGIVVLALGLATTPAVRVFAEAPAINGVLVLRNGNVLSGAVRRYGDDYRVDVADATMRVPADKVERFAATLQEAYEARRAALAVASADAHLELAQWCLRLNLFDEAAREMLDARTLDPANTELIGLQVRLREAIELENSRREPSPVIETAADAPAVEAMAPPIAISSEAQIQFVRSIQPMLVRSCALGGCHQAGGAQQLQLDRWALEGNGNADSVRRNLTSVLRELNAEDPSSSVLVHWARLTHGRRDGVGSRPLTARQAALLIEWLKQAAGIETTPTTVPTKVEGEQLAAATGEPMMSAPTPAATQIEGFAPAVSPVQRARSRRLVPHDAFDAEIFNRRAARHAAKESADEGAQEARNVEKSALDAGSERGPDSGVVPAASSEEVSAPTE